MSKLSKYQKLVFYSFITFSVAYSIFTVTRIILNFHLQDFSVYYQGIQDYLAHKNPYTNLRAGNVIYPPFSLVLLSPFGLFPYKLAENVWTLLSFSLGVASIIILLKSVGQKKLLIPFLVVYSLFMLSFPVKFSLGMGQANLILLFLISLSFYYFQKKQPLLSGIVLAIAASVKLSPIILLFFYTRKKQWKIVASCLVATVLMNLLGATLLGKQAAADYWRSIFPGFIAAGGSAYYYNQALTAWLSRALVPTSITRVANHLAFGGLLLLSLKATKVVRKRPKLELGEYGLYILTILIGGGLAWQHHFVTTLIPFVALSIILLEKKRSYTLITLALLSYLLIAANIKNPTTYSSPISQLLLSHVLYGAMLLYGLGFLCIKPKSSFPQVKI